MSYHLSPLILAMLLAGCVAGTQVWADSTASASSKLRAAQSHPGLPDSVRTAIASGDYQRVYDALLTALKQNKIEPHQPQQLRLATLLELIRVTDPEVMTSFAAQSGKHKKFLAQLASDQTWQELYLSCGLVPYKTPVGMDVMYRIWKKEKGNIRNKKLAVALASVWGGGETAPNPNLQKLNPKTHDPVWRYEFFNKQEAGGKLHRNYAKLQPWELRFVVSIPAQDWDDQSFVWVANNINLPPEQYSIACWAAIYTDPSKFGDSVQSGEFTLPFNQESAAENTHRNGGVCGSLSHLGAYAAMSHGIPAYTVGQPGHCAYGIRPERGKWIGGFGGPDGDMHNHIFGSKAPTSYRLMEEVYADDAKVTEAYRASYCARALEAVGDTEGALVMWKQALKATPLHPFMRTALHRLMKEKGLTTQELVTYLKELLPLYKGQGYAAVDIVMADFPDELKRLDEQEMAKLFLELHQQIASTPSSWAATTDKLLDTQATYLPDNLLPGFLSHVMACHMSSGDGAALGQVLEWTIKRYVDGNNADVFAAIFKKAASMATLPTTTGESAEQRDKNLISALSKAILSTEEARSRVAFQTVADAADMMLPEQAKQANSQLTKLGEMKGRLIPSSGLLRLSTTCIWDTPLLHRNVLTQKGGKFHTKDEDKPYVIVELAEGANLTGCLLRKTDAEGYRMKKVAIFTSQDGATWVKRTDTDNMPQEWAVNFPEAVPAKWVKVEFDNTGKPMPAHLTHILLFQQ